MTAVHQWIGATPALEFVRQQLDMSVEEFQEWLPQALVTSKAAVIEQGHLINLD
jgi:hypothetical protein